LYLKIFQFLDTRKLYAKRCKYQLILEDDIIAQFNWFNRIKSIIVSIETNNQNEDKWLAVKLFTGYFFFDWDWIMHWNIWSEVIVISLIIAFFTYIFVNNLTFHRIKKIKFLLILINSLALVSFYNATRVAPFKWYALREHPTRFGCVAVLFNKNNSIKFAKYLEQVVNDFLTGKSNFFLNKDLLIEIFRRKNNLVEFIAEPSVF